jgi:tetratricopeptide (TPR) repeat protein
MRSLVLPLLLVATPSLAQDAAPPAPAAAPAPAAEPAPAAPETPETPETPEQAGDRLMKTRKLADYQAAIVKFDEALKQKPDDADLLVKAAEARVAVMRTKGHGNLVQVDGTSDNAANKKVWATFGKTAVDLAKRGYDKKPNDRQALLTYTEAYMFYSASFGILKALFAGAADEYKANANALIKKYPKADNAVGDIYMGAFYMVAPWPMSDAKKARQHFDKALERVPNSLRNHHYVALQALKDGRLDVAKKHWEHVRDNKCVRRGSEVDFCGFLKKQSKRGLEEVKKKGG